VRTLEFMFTQFGLNKLKTSLYRVVQKCFDILNRLGVAHKCDRQTDSQTDRQNRR